MEKKVPSWEKCASVLLVVAGPALAACPAERAHGVHLGKQFFQVEVAADDASREHGLSGHRPLLGNAGMWFVLDQPARPGFWMRGMTFPIDLVWVSPAKRVVGVETLNVCRTDPCPISFPPVEVQYILEIAAGRYAGKVGDTVSWTCSRPRK